MTKSERTKFADLLIRQEVLVKRVKELDNKSQKGLTEVEQHQLDQWYGECLGIETALSAFKIPFKSIDGR